jgi:hypothetical protein
MRILSGSAVRAVRFAGEFNRSIKGRNGIRESKAREDREDAKKEKGDVSAAFFPSSPR